jgi:hypothetical protein
MRAGDSRRSPMLHVPAMEGKVLVVSIFVRPLGEAQSIVHEVTDEEML